MKTEIIKTSKLNNNTGQVAGLPKNPRFLKDDKFLKLKKSIEQDPEMLELREVLAYDNGGELVVIGGNMRLRACKELGIKEVPCKILPKETPIEKLKAYTIKDNSSFGDWDFDLLANEWDAMDLECWGVDIPETKADLFVEDDGFEVPNENGIKTKIVLGDLIEIGSHRLLCGDSTISTDFEKLMNGKVADLYISDPPYGVAYKGKTKDALEIKNDSLSEEATYELFANAFSNAFANLKEGGSIYQTVPAGLLQLGFMKVMYDFGCLRQCMIWDKGQMDLSYSDYHYQHEPILYGRKPNGTHYFTKDRTKTTVLSFPKPLRNAEHPTMKPVELWSELIQNSSIEGNLCIDTFLGSGTTMVSCHQLNRVCYGIEIDPKYCQVIIDRMLKLDSSLSVKVNGIDYTEF